MLTDTISVPSLEPTKRSRRGVTIASDAREQRSKKMSEGNEGKGKRMHPEGSTSSLSPCRRALTGMEEGDNLPLIPLATGVILEGVQF